MFSETNLDDLLMHMLPLPSGNIYVVSFRMQIKTPSDVPPLPEEEEPWPYSHCASMCWSYCPSGLPLSGPIQAVRTQPRAQPRAGTPYRYTELILRQTNDCISEMKTLGPTKRGAVTGTRSHSWDHTPGPWLLDCLPTLSVLAPTWKPDIHLG